MDTKALFQVVDSLLGNSRQLVLPSDIPESTVANEFGKYFHDKIAKITLDFQHFDDTESDVCTGILRHQKRPGVPSSDTEDIACVGIPSQQVRTGVTSHLSSSCPHSWDTFQLVSPEDVTNIIKNSPSKSCKLDPVPTIILKHCTGELAPFVASIINSSLESGKCPDIFKKALVTPLIKKANLDREVLGNYRPVSNLSFLFKVLEKVVAKQLNAYLQQNDLFETFQSAYRRFHSTETALLKIKDDVCSAIGNRKAVLLLLIDLSSAFDTIDHARLINILEAIGIHGHVLAWIESYLSDRNQTIICGDFSSPSFDLTTGVPQGSVLGPILFITYISSLGKALEGIGTKYHFYADDTQIYLTFDPKEESPSFTKMQSCINLVRRWMYSNHLKMNDGKTEAMIFGSCSTISKISHDSVTVGTQVVNIQSRAKSLGFIFDSKFSCEDQVTAQCRSAYMHLRSISRIKQHLPPDCLATLVHAFVTSRLDYANSLYLGASNSVIDRLQCVQNAAARLITGTRKFDRITPVLYELHWLPVRQRIKFKVLLIMFKVRNGLAPIYLMDLFKIYNPPRQLRSNNGTCFEVPFTRSSLIKESTISVAGPALWNSLPNDIKMLDSIDAFKKNLKTILFAEHFY
jgi:hypothetical protein